MLKPVIKLLIDQGITHQEFAEAGKEIYVETAVRQSIEAGRLNKSRIAIVTGLTRKEVANVITRALNQERVGKNFSRPGRVLHGWHNDPEYTGPYGVPMEIPYEAPVGGTTAPSFVHLVKTYSGDQSPKQMLDELLRVGAITKLEDGAYKVLRRDFEPESLSPKLIERFGDIGFNLLTTLSANVQKSGIGEGIFDRVVISNSKLNQQELRAFESYLKSRGQQILEEIDNWLTREVEDKAADDSESFESGLAMIQYIVNKPEDKRSLSDLLSEIGLESED
jgi:hypothetical protein